MGFQMVVKSQNGDFTENGSRDVDNISVIYGGHLLKQNCIRGRFEKITLRALGAQTRNVDSVETDFTGHTDFIFVRYSAVSDGREIIGFVSNVP
jgi:hypothetical protein